ncbi:MAG: protein kinase domain-containing protein [Planctomycetaceae bacterium]
MAEQLSPEQFMQRVIGAGLAEPLQVDQARAELGSQDVTTQALARVMQRRGVLTTLQTDKILKGDRTGFFYGEYKVLYLIGAGTFARVYRAARGDNAAFAIKVLRKRFRDQMDQQDQFLREARMGLRLRHPNIVSIYAVDPDVRNPYMVMEFVEGQTLRELVRLRGQVDPLTSLKLIHDVVSGLAYAASLGISHRDMKLSNVLVGSDGRAKLVDFGLAALADRSNPDQIADCPNARAIDYAALERGTGVRKDDPRSDIFFVGTMLYHMVAGKPALTETRDRLQRLNVTRFQEIKPLHELVPDVPPPLNHIVSKATAFNPEERFQTAAEMQSEVKKAIDRIERGEKTANVGNVSEEVRQYEEDDGPMDEGEGRVVMLVESQAALQNAIRDRLKARGYRVLIISNPNRAIERFVEGEMFPADLVIFSAAEMGSLALEAHNKFASDEHTSEIPTILLVDRRQEKIIREARRGVHRKLLPLPLKVRELRGALLQLLAGVPRRSFGSY